MMNPWSLVFGLEKYVEVTGPCSGDRRNHGPSKVTSSNVAGSAEAKNWGESVMAEPIAA